MLILNGAIVFFGKDLKLINLTVILLFGVAIGIVATFLYADIEIGLIQFARLVQSVSIDVSFPDVVLIMLSSLAVLITFLTVVIVILAFRTLAEIKKTAKKVAIKEVKVVVKRELKNIVIHEISESFKSHFDQRVPELLESPEFAARIENIISKEQAAEYLGYNELQSNSDNTQRSKGNENQSN